MIGLAFLTLSVSASGALAAAPVPSAVQLFKAACIDGSARLSRPDKIRGRDLAPGSRGALFRATRLQYYLDKSPPADFRDFGDIYRTSERPLTYLVPQLSPEASQSSQPICVVLTKDDVAWDAQREIRRWVKPGEVLSQQALNPKVGSRYKSGFISDRTFEARLGKNSVAVFRHGGWTVMRTLDHTGRLHPYEIPPTRKQD